MTRTFLVKHALKTAIGATILGAVFQQSESIAIVNYPAMGLVATMQSSLGGTLQAGWGRLGGSVVAGIIGALLLSVWGSNPITAGMAFVLAALFCDLWQLPSLFNQAGMIACLIAASEIGHGDNPWVYALERVHDNGIGVVIGTVVTMLFWPDNPRKTLVDNFSQVLLNCDRLFQGIVSNCFDSEKTDLSELLSQSKNKIEQSQSLFDKSTYGWAGRQLTQENWSEILASQRHFLRYLSILSNLSKHFDDRTFIQQFKPELFQISQQLSVVFQEVSRCFRTHQPLTISQITDLHEQLQSVRQKLILFQTNIQIDRELFTNLLDLHAFLNALKELLQELEQIVYKRNERHQTRVSTTKNKFSLKPVSQERLIYFLKTGVTIGLSLAVLNYFLEVSYNFYAIIGIVITMQPTLGKGITGGSQRVIMTLVGAIYALIIINTLGANYLTLGLGVFLTIVTSAYLGFTQGFQAACYPVIIAILAHSDIHNVYILGRLNETILGVIIGVIASLIFSIDTAANKLDRQLVTTFKTIKDFYYIILNNYLQSLIDKQETEEITQKIRQFIQIQLSLQAETQQERTDELMAARKQRLWNFLNNSAIKIVQHLLYLDSAIQKQSSDKFSHEFETELQAIMQTTLQGFNTLIIAIGRQTKQPSIELLKPCVELEDKLLERQKRQTISVHDLEAEIDFFVIVATLKEITAIVEQTMTNFPDYKS